MVMKREMVLRRASLLRIHLRSAFSQVNPYNYYYFSSSSEIGEINKRGYVYARKNKKVEMSDVYMTRIRCQEFFFVYV